jgi:hypothetical protein
VFSFESGGAVQYAIGEYLALPDADWFRIELTHPIVADTEYRFDCLRMMHTHTHVDLSVEPGSPMIVRLITRHRGLINMLFVIRDGLALKNPYLI